MILFSALTELKKTVLGYSVVTSSKPKSALSFSDSVGGRNDKSVLVTAVL